LTAIVLADHVPVVIVPTDVRLDAVTPLPSVLADRTETPLIRYSLPLAIDKFSELVQAPVALYQIEVLSVAPLSEIPPPSAVASVGLATAPSSRFLSSTLTVVELIVTVVPLTVQVARYCQVSTVRSTSRLKISSIGI
jgi:hypothetical protein